MDDPRGALGYDGSVNHLVRCRLALSLSLIAPLSLAGLSLAGLSGCSDAADDPDVPTFQGTNGGVAPANGVPGAGAPANGATTPPSAVPPGTATPPGSEQQPPVTGGIDTSGTAAPGMVGASAGAGGTPGNPAQPPVTPETPAPGAVASGGCGLSQGMPASLDFPDTLVFPPPTYDGSTPVPLVFAFHGAGRTNVDQRTVDSRTVGSDLENNYVVAYMKSAGNAWDLGTDYPRFQAVRQQILSQLCIDTAHVFAFGHSSGAQFIVQMLGDNRARETGFAAIAPVSSSRYPNPAWSPVPTLLIHGLNDTQRGGDNDGAQDIAQYAESNQCPGARTDVAVPSCASLAGGVAVNAGCKEYTGCAAPTLFCNHDDPNYLENNNPTNHGWPCFANSQIFAFFESFR
jgi:hypothetical protein